MAVLHYSFGVCIAGWDLGLTRAKWQKNRKKMAGRMGKKSGRVR